jgi:hypothetical protein
MFPDFGIVPLSAASSQYGMTAKSFTSNFNKEDLARIQQLIFSLKKIRLIKRIAYTGKRTRTVTATAPSLAIPTTLPTELAGTTLQKFYRIALINVIITRRHR